MEISLEKIELVKDRTGVTYAEAKEALEAADGSVVDAIIAIEESVNSGAKGRGFGEKGEALFAKLKELVKKGNVAKIQVKRDGEAILNVPVNVGIVGIVIAPIASVVAVVAAFGFKCEIEVVKTDGTIIDVSDTVSEKVVKASEKGKEYYEKAKDSETYENLKAKGKEYYEKGKEIGKEYYDKAKDSETYDKIKDKVDDLKDNEKVQAAMDKAGEYYDKAKDKAGEVADKVKKEAEELNIDDAFEDEPEDVKVKVEVEDEK